MTDREFTLRQSSTYSGERNDVEHLSVELLEGGAWTPFELTLRTKGFLIFVYTLLTCQHTHMRLGAADRSLLLSESGGRIDVVTSEDWMLRKVHVHFDATLRSGEPGEEDIEIITVRMGNCPVARNLKPFDGACSELVFS